MKSLSFYNYIVYENGQIYSLYAKKYLKPDVTKDGYEQVTLRINKKPVRYKVHRLVALLFLENPNNYPIVHHKDANKRNNSLENLEWCTYKYNNKHARDAGINNVSKSNSKRWENNEFRIRTSKNISNGLVKNGSNKWKNNPRFKYLITINGKEIERSELASILNITLSIVDRLIRNAAAGETIDRFIEKNIKVINVKRES